MDVNKPLVSLIVRTKDRPKLLENALQSIADQTYRPLEMIVVNDGGQPVDPEDLKEKYTGVSVVYVENETSLGRSEAGNMGMDAASGKYFGFLDDDDALYPDHVEVLAGFLESNDYRVAYADVEERRLIFSSETLAYEKEVVNTYSKDFNYNELLLYNYIPFNAILFSRAAAGEERLDKRFDLYEDWEFLIRIGRAHPFFHIERTTACYNHWSDDLQINNLNNVDLMKENQIKIIGRHMDKIPAGFLREVWIQSQHAAARVENLEATCQDQWSSIRNKDHRIQELSQLVQQRENRIQNLNQTLQQKENRIQEQQASFRKQFQNQEKVLQHQKEQIGENRKEIAQLSENSASLSAAIDEKNRQLQAVTTHRDELQKAREDLRNQLHALALPNILRVQARGRRFLRRQLTPVVSDANHAVYENGGVRVTGENPFVTLQFKKRFKFFKIAYKITAGDAHAKILVYSKNSRADENFSVDRFELDHLNGQIQGQLCRFPKRVDTIRFLFMGSGPFVFEHLLFLKISRTEYMVQRMREVNRTSRRLLSVQPHLKQRFFEELKTSGVRGSLQKVRQRVALESSPGRPPESVTLPSVAQQGAWDRESIILVSHDLEKAGAQINLLHKGQSVKAFYGKPVIFVTLKGGVLKEDFKKIGPVFDLNEPSLSDLVNRDQADDLFKRFRAAGIDKCICNTIVTGLLAPILAKYGFAFVNLIHELPTLVHLHNFHKARKAIESHGQMIVFSSNYSRRAYTKEFRIDDAKTMVKAQGCYIKSAHSENREEARQNLRKLLDLPEDARIVLSCGYMYPRKGPDLFFRTAVNVLQEGQNRHIHFAWLGDRHPESQDWMIHDATIMGIRDQFHFIDFVKDPSEIFAGSDLFILTSREDPFPTVVMEAMDNRIPVIAFEKSGGIPELLEDGCGVLVPYLDTEKMADAVLSLLENQDQYKAIADAGKQRIETDYNYDDYVGVLLNLLDEQVVPGVPRETADSEPDQSRPVTYFDHLFEAARKKSPEFVPYKAYDPTSFDVRTIAFFLPQFHAIPENDEWWGKGFTEWTNVTKAVPQFMGHYQPRLPGELGFYDLSNPEVQRRQAELARNYGISGFCYYYYWFSGRRLLETPLDNLAANPDIDMPFCICWANENWTRRWDGLDNELLMYQDFEPKDDVRFIRDVSVHFKDDRYIRINGNPLLIIYRPDLFPNPSQTASTWRQWCRDNGVGEIYLCNVQSFDHQDPRKIGYDAAIEFPPNRFPVSRVNHAVELVNTAYAGNIFDYNEVADISLKKKETAYKRFRGITPSWDNEARKPGKGTVLINSNPKTYGHWLDHLVQYTDGRFEGDEKLVFINAWNEWAEGSCLEPDRKFGYGYLDATRRALTAVETEKRKRVKDTVRDMGKTSDTAVIVHLYYHELWDEIAAYLKQIPEPFDLYISLNPAAPVSRVDGVLETFPTARLFMFENRGRDILPFMNIFRQISGFGYQYVCKIHSKKSTHTDVGNTWRNNIFKALLGSPERVREIQSLFDTDKTLGILAPEKYLIRFYDCVGYDEAHAAKNMEYINRFVKELKTKILDSELFATGTMFWFRPDALKKMLDLDISPQAYPLEASQIDGTIMHALERVMTICARKSGYTYKDTGQCVSAAVRGEK